MNKLTITCPYCEKDFSADDALKNHLRDKEVRFQKEIKTKEKMLESKYKLELQLQEKKLEKDLIKKVEEANKNKLHSLQAKIDISEKNKKTLEEKYTNNLAIIENKMSKKLKQQEEFFEKKAKSEVQLEIAKLAKQNLEKDKQLLAKDKETEIFKKRQQKRIEEMEKQLKQKSTEVQGEIQEELLQDFLKNKFPQDRIIEIKKGAKGGDCILSINHKDKSDLAQIYFESKDHKLFKEEWISKLLKDMKDKSIDCGILVTTALPKDFCKYEGHLERHGKRIMIVPMDYRIIHTLVTSIRSNIIDKYNAKKDFDAPKEMKRLWDHITGPTFQLPVRNLYENIKKMNILIEKEKAFNNKNIANKERTMQDMDEEFKGMINSFINKVGDEVLPDTLLQITGDKEKII